MGERAGLEARRTREDVLGSRACIHREGVTPVRMGAVAGEDGSRRRGEWESVAGENGSRRRRERSIGSGPSGDLEVSGRTIGTSASLQVKGWRPVRQRDPRGRLRPTPEVVKDETPHSTRPHYVHMTCQRGSRPESLLATPSLVGGYISQASRAGRTRPSRNEAQTQ